MSTKRAVYDIAEFKALPDEGVEKGKFEALVSVFGNVDVQGDRVVDGAFTKSIESWRASGAPIPIIWSHNWGDPNAHIGSADPNDVVEVKGRGLQVGGTIDLDNPFAAQVYRLVKERRVKEFSFGYEVVKERKAKDGANELLELRLIEAGPTLKGANPNTELLAVKSQLEEAAAQEAEPLVDEAVKAYVEGRFAEFTAELGLTKAGRQISAKNAALLRGAVESIETVLASTGDADEKAPGAEEVKVKADEPKVANHELLDLQARILELKG